jgi:mannose-6-phosphate isomerase-like protein (cupin superfamily)
MKRSFGYHTRSNFVWLVIVPLLLIAPSRSTSAAQLREAHVTRIIKEVQLLPAQAAPRPAVVNDNVRSGTAVRTGADSRTELTFTDLTLARLGANTIFSFNEGTRTLDLGGGAVLLQVPKGAGGAKITTAAVTAAITGTTVLMEYHRNAYIKFIVLEGIARMYLKNRLGESALIGPGQMLIVNPNAKSLPDPVHVDLKRLAKTCLLITEFAPLASQPLILQQIQIQQNNTDLIPTNLVIFGRGTLVSLVDPTNVNVISQQTAAIATPTPTPTPIPTPTPTPTPTQTPSKFGTPSVITSPAPYVITSGTTISTDPSITTNGVTDFGKIWRGQAQDGLLSAFIFGSTSAFDTASGFDSEINGQNSMGGAGFKFTSLQLTGNPTVSTPTGVINLGLIAVNGITSGGPGGTLTFAGIRGLLIAAQNGSINLGSEISFSGIHDINFYARGAGSNLTLGSAISGGTGIRLWAQGTIQINGDESATDFRAFSGGDFLAGTGTVTATDINIQSLSNVNIDASKFPDVAGGAINLNAANTLSIVFVNPGGMPFPRASLTGQANTINLQFGSPNTFNLGSAAVSFVAGSGGIQAPNVLFANGSLLLLEGTGDISIYGTQNGANSSGGDIIVAGGAFNAQSDVSAVGVTAGTSINIGGSIFASSGVSAGTTMNVVGTLTAPVAAAGGDITAGTLSSTDVTTMGNIIVGSGGIRQFTLPSGPVPPVLHTLTAGSVTSQGGINFNGTDGTTSSSPTDGGQLTINVNSLNIGTDIVGPVTFDGGSGANSMSGGANGGTFTVNTTGPITVNSDIEATTGNQPIAFAPAGNGGTVNLNSTNDTVTVNSRIEVSSTPVGTGQSFVRRSARGGNIHITSGKAGPIGARAVAINVGSSAQLLALLDAAAPGPGGQITILATGANSDTNVSGRMQADRGGIDIRHTGDSGNINLTNADVRADVVKAAALGNNGVLNIGGGTLSADTTLKLYSTGSNGSVNFIANVTLGGASQKIIAGNAVTIFNNVTVTILGQTPASVFTNAANYSGFGGNGSTTGTFGGIGASNPQPLVNAPPIGPPGVP